MGHAWQSCSAAGVWFWAAVADDQWRRHQRTVAKRPPVRMAPHERPRPPASAHLNRKYDA